jgi:acylphosphatase
MDVQRKRIVVSGRVQGVGFRIYVLGVARGLGVAGTVRNLGDGRSVETIAQADAPTMERFIAAVRQGPPGGLVTEYKTEEETPDTTLRGFEIVR